MADKSAPITPLTFREWAARRPGQLDPKQADTFADEVLSRFQRIASQHDHPGLAEYQGEGIAALARASVDAADLQVRLSAAERLSDAYAALYNTTASADGSLSVAGRIGPLQVAAPGAGNAGLARLLGLWALGGRIILPEVEIPIPGGGTRPCVPGQVRVTLRKAGALPDLTEPGLDPDFVAWLRSQGDPDLLALRAFAEWRAAQGLVDPPTSADRRAYETALASAWRRFDESRYTDRYCRPGDIPAPGVQYGHRLLRLPLRLTEGDFRDAGCGPRIYEGPLGAPKPPELDYVELVRRYVDLLQAGGRIPGAVHAVTRDQILESHLRRLGPTDRPAILQLLTTASQVALQTRGLAGLIEIDDGLRRRGQGLADWLQGPAAEDVRTAVIESWQRLLAPPASSPPQATPQLPTATLSPVEFNRALTALCVPPLVAPGGSVNVESRLLGFSPGTFFRNPGGNPPVPQRSPSAVVAEIERLATRFGEVWTAAAGLLGLPGILGARGEIRLSPPEARAWLAHLCIHCLVSLSGNYALGAPAGRAIVEEVLRWLAQGAVPLRFEDVLGPLPASGNNPPTEIDPERIAARVMWGTSPPPAAANGWQLTDPALALVRALTDSYAAALDVVTSAGSLPAAAMAASATDPYRVAAAELPALYVRWAGLFAALTQEARDQHRVTDDQLLVLRLVPRRGRYGETPQRSAIEELRPEVKALPWPGHPARATEGYVLEPLPLGRFMHDTPTLYLREDYRLALMSRGYGIGSNLYSMSLLPEEEQTLVVKSFKDTRSKVSESTAENVFEETGSETANDFANEVARETQQESSNETDFNVAAKASASFLFGSAELSSGYSAKDSARDFAKNVSNVTSKLAQKLSAKRTVSVETKRDREIEEGTRAEISSERKIRNPNLGHTVSFHWFQMTRRFLQELTLEDVKLVYGSGKHNVLRILSAGELPAEVTGLPEWQSGQLKQVASALPADIAQRLPPGAAVVIVGEPYTEVVTMAGANAFLARLLRTPVAVETNGLIWQHLGYFDAAPEGLGVLAFSGNRRGEAGAQEFVPLFNPDPGQLGDPANVEHVVADRLAVSVPNAGQAAEDLYLPNLDLRYRLRDGLPPARYSAEAQDPYAVPRLMAAEEQVVNTNGVYCEAMVGRCTALEDYLQRHRDLDLLDKRIQTGLQEIEFRFALARDGLTEVVDDGHGNLTAVVATPEAGGGFAERLGVEHERLAEQRQMAADGLERRRAAAAVGLLEQQVQELARRIELLGTPPEIRIDAPEGSPVTVQANVDIGSDPLGGGHVSVD